MSAFSLVDKHLEFGDYSTLAGFMMERAMARIANRPAGTLEERVRAKAEAKKAEAMKLRPGPAQDALLAEARRMEVTSDLDKWVASPGLRPPT